MAIQAPVDLAYEYQRFSGPGRSAFDKRGILDLDNLHRAIRIGARLMPLSWVFKTVGY